MGGCDRIQPCKFFISFLATASAEEARSYLEKLREEADKIEESCIQVCYHMKGVTWNEVWGMSPDQRGKIIEYVNKIYKQREEAMTGKKTM